MIDTQSMLDELCLDATDETTQLITDLLSQSESIIRDSVDKTKPIASYEQDPIFIRAAKTLCTQLYYDRALTWRDVDWLTDDDQSLKRRGGSRWLRAEQYRIAISRIRCGIPQSLVLLVTAENGMGISMPNFCQSV
jgi:hypothetical protein